MAKLTFTLSEIIEIAKLNIKHLPKQIESIDTKDNHLKLRINLGKLLPNFDVFVYIRSFEHDILMIELESKAPIKILMKFMKGFLKKLPKYYELNIQGNIIQININNIISQKIKGVKVKSIVEKDGTFEIEI